MKLIPALDLKHGHVVHATGNNREAYRPLSNRWFPSSSLNDVALRLHERLHCQTFYIADLDAICGEGNNAPLIHELAKKFPDFSLWLDAGVRNHTDFERLRRSYSMGHSMATLIVATETMNDARLLETLHDTREEFILSLDFVADGLSGDESVFESSEHWPEIVIALSLPSIGANTGPNLKNIRTLLKKYPRRRFVVGGGIRDERDLELLQKNGVDTVLIANALYTGVIKTQTKPAST